MNGSDRLDRTLAIAAGAALFAWFLFVVRGGLSSWFDADDLMNITYYWVRPWSALLKANVEFWSSYYRPGGGLFYRTIYDLWGFHPLPFRIAVFALLAVNFALTLLVLWQLTRSRWGTLAAAFVLINPACSSAYFDTGSIYDVLAFTFFWGAFALYVHTRRSKGHSSTEHGPPLTAPRLSHIPPHHRFPNPNLRLPNSNLRLPNSNRRFPSPDRQGVGHPQASS